MVDLDDVVGGSSGMYFRSISERDISGYELKGCGRRVFVELLMLLIDGLI